MPSDRDGEGVHTPSSGEMLDLDDAHREPKFHDFDVGVPEEDDEERRLLLQKVAQIRSGAVPGGDACEDDPRNYEDDLQALTETLRREALSSPQHVVRRSPPPTSTHLGDALLMRDLSPSSRSTRRISPPRHRIEEELWRGLDTSPRQPKQLQEPYGPPADETVIPFAKSVVSAVDEVLSAPSLQPRTRMPTSSIEPQLPKLSEGRSSSKLSTGSVNKSPRDPKKSDVRFRDGQRSRTATRAAHPPTTKRVHDTPSQSDVLSKVAETIDRLGGRSSPSIATPAGRTPSRIRDALTRSKGDPEVPSDANDGSDNAHSADLSQLSKKEKAAIWLKEYSSFVGAKPQAEPAVPTPSHGRQNAAVNSTSQREEFDARSPDVPKSLAGTDSTTDHSWSKWEDLTKRMDNVERLMHDRDREIRWRIKPHEGDSDELGRELTSELRGLRQALRGGEVQRFRKASDPYAEERSQFQRAMLEKASTHAKRISKLKSFLFWHTTMSREKLGKASDVVRKSLEDQRKTLEAFSIDNETALTISDNSFRTLLNIQDMLRQQQNEKGVDNRAISALVATALDNAQSLSLHFQDAGYRVQQSLEQLTPHE